MAPQPKEYYSVDTSEELGMVSEASRHTATTEVDLEMISTEESFDDDGMGTPRARSCVSRACSPLTDYLRSYQAAELIICLTFFLVTNTSSSWLDITPHQRPLPVQYLQDSNEYVMNLTHNEEFTGETVPYELLILLSGVLPLVVQVLLSLCARRSSPIHEVHQTLCVYFVAWSLNMIASEFVKNYVGYLRPIFFQFCEPNEDYSSCVENSQSIRKSFVSGHSSTAFCGMMLLCLYINARFGVTSKRCYRPVPTTKGERVRGGGVLKLSYEQDEGMLLARLCSLLALVPMFVALWIAASRVRDNKHFPADVLGGAMLGSALATYSHGLWFV